MQKNLCQLFLYFIGFHFCLDFFVVDEDGNPIEQALPPDIEAELRREAWTRFPWTRPSDLLAHGSPPR